MTAVARLLVSGAGTLRVAPNTWTVEVPRDCEDCVGLARAIDAFIARR